VVKSRLFRCLYPCNLMYLVHLAVLHRLVHAGSCIVVGPTVPHTCRLRAHRTRPKDPSAPLRLTPPLAEPASHYFVIPFTRPLPPSLSLTHSLIQPAAHVQEASEYAKPGRPIQPNVVPPTKQSSTYHRPKLDTSKILSSIYPDDPAFTPLISPTCCFADRLSLCGITESDLRQLEPFCRRECCREWTDDF